MTPVNTKLGISPEWMDLSAIRRYCTVSERTLRGWITSPIDPLPASRIGGKILVRRSDFDQWAERHRITAHSLDLDSVVQELLQGN